MKYPDVTGELLIVDLVKGSTGLGKKFKFKFYSPYANMAAAN